MSTNTEFMEFTKDVARNAFLDYFHPLTSFTHWLKRKRVFGRFALAEFRASRGSHGVRWATLRLLERVVGTAAPLEATTVADQLVAEIQTLRETVAFYELRKRARLDLAVAAERVGNHALLRALVSELMAIDSQRGEVVRRLSQAEYRHSIQHPNSYEMPEVEEASITLQAILTLAKRRSEPGSDSENVSLINRELVAAHRRTR